LASYKTALKASALEAKHLLLQLLYVQEADHQEGAHGIILKARGKDLLADSEDVCRNSKTDTYG
jgi:hypothetical protein